MVTALAGAVIPLAALAARAGECTTLPNGQVICSTGIEQPGNPGNPGGGGGAGGGGGGGGNGGGDDGGGVIDPVGNGGGNGDGGGPVDTGVGVSTCLGLPGGCPATPAPPAAPGGGGPAAPPPPSPSEVARAAYAKIVLPKPAIGSAPCTGARCRGAVGLPVWLWTDPANWAPRTASASLGGVTVNVSARPRSVTWSMGDGSKVTCTTPGTKYELRYGFRSSPDCGYKYLKTSGNKSGGRYALNAVFTYDVVFSGAYTARLNPTTSSSTSVGIGEYQAIVVR